MSTLNIRVLTVVHSRAFVKALPPAYLSPEPYDIKNIIYGTDSTHGRKSFLSHHFRDAERVHKRCNLAKAKGYGGRNKVSDISLSDHSLF